MNKRTTKAAREHAVAEFPRECCGLVIAEDGKERYVPCRNIADDREEEFILSPEDYANAEDRGQILAIVHSHPNHPARPSLADRVGCEASGLPWHIIHVSIPEGEDAPVAGEIHSFEPDGFEAPLIGRVFTHGTLDCYGLIRDFYKRELKIEIPDFDRRMGWWDNGGDLYMENFRTAGFEITRDEPKYGDVILMQIRADVVNHAGIYLGDGSFMHHMIQRLSAREVYGGYWAEKTRYFIRHREMT